MAKKNCSKELEYPAVLYWINLECLVEGPKALHVPVGSYAKEKTIFQAKLMLHVHT